MSGGEEIGCVVKRWTRWALPCPRTGGALARASMLHALAGGLELRDGSPGGEHRADEDKREARDHLRREVLVEDHDAEHGGYFQVPAGAAR